MIKLWDALVYLLVFFPLFLGGFWIQRPGLKIELTELAVPVLIVSVVGLIVFRVLNRNLADSSAYQKGAKLWTTWESAVQSRPRRTLWTGALLVGMILSYASLRRHWAFGSAALDLSIFQNALWNLTQGNGYVSSVKDGINLFLDHQSPILWLIAPLFKLFPYTETLLLVQGFGLSLGGVAVYYLGKQHGFKWPALLPILYWAYLPTRNANAFDFHPEVLMLPLFLGAIAGLQSARSLYRGLGLLFFILALGCKESAGPVAAGISIAWIVGAGPLATRSFTRKLGIVTLLLGLSVFYFDTKIVPQLLGGKYGHTASYQQFGSGMIDLFLAPLFLPSLFFSTLFGPTRLKFIFGTLVPLAFLPLFGGRALLAAIPGYLMILLIEGDRRVSLQYYYAIEPAVGLFWALSAAKLNEHPLWRGLKRPELWIAFCALVSFGRSEIFRIRFFEPSPHHRWLSQKVLPCLTQASLAATGPIAAQLASRNWIHDLPEIGMPGGKTVSCVVFDSSLNNWPMTDIELTGLEKRLEALGYSRAYQCRELGIFQLQGNTEIKKGSPDADQGCLKCIPECMGLND